MIYFIVTEDYQYMKIGFSKDPARRLRGLQTGCPYRLRILFTIPGSKELEAHLHTVYHNYRINGEWFQIEPSLLHSVYEHITAN
mgnify:CR=1 FL=1